MHFATAVANANIALIKYWGKRDEKLMLPTKNSFSVSLNALNTTTKVSFANNDSLLINGVAATTKSQEKFFHFLVEFREKYKINSNFCVESINNFPTAAGLASSASGFAALTLALNDLCGLGLERKKLSMLARLGSGSASRSVYNGFVLFNRGSLSDGLDAFAEQIFDDSHWPEFRIIVVVLESGPKKISSSQAMKITTSTSTSYVDWVDQSNLRLPQMIDAVAQKDIAAVGTLAEQDCLGMHQTMRDASPSINYFNGCTWQVVNAVRQLRDSGVECYFTIDAGPNVKVLTTSFEQKKVLNTLAQLTGVQRIIVSGI